MMELVHMTAQYSNAVLVAVLPYVTDFAAKLDLPIERPVTSKQIIWCKPSPYKDYIKAGLILTNHYWFAVDPRGFVEGFRAPTNWFFEQEFTPENVSKYLGHGHMTTNEIISMARETLMRLGYEPGLTHSYEPPGVEGPYNINMGYVPYCRIEWEWPKTDEMGDCNHIQVEINTETKALVGLTLVFSRTNHFSSTPVKVDAMPELEADYRKRLKTHSQDVHQH
jgi:hypothetical protein